MQLPAALASIFVAIANPAIATTSSQAPPRLIGGDELRQLIRGAVVGPFDYAPEWMNEVFRRDGSYQQTDGAREGDVGTYYFAGNRFCIKIRRKSDHCRSVLIDGNKRTWLIDEGAESRPVRVNISHY